METYINLKNFTHNPDFKKQKELCLEHLTDDMIDSPIVEIVRGLNRLPYCFTLQSCYGHFTYKDQKDPNNLAHIPVSGINNVKYRIAYIALCIEDSPSGKQFFNALKEIPDISPQNIQFCCAEWFWKKQVNSYVLQVEPERFKNQDTAKIDIEEALQIEKIRENFFIRLDELLNKSVIYRGRS